MRYRVIEGLSLCKVEGGSVPLWAMAGAADPATVFFHILRSPGEITLACPTHLVPKAEAGLVVHSGYAALQLEGPFALDVVGILKAFLAPLADAAIPIFAISSYATDFVLIEASRLDEAQRQLSRAGYEIFTG